MRTTISIIDAGLSVTGLASDGDQLFVTALGDGLGILSGATIKWLQTELKDRITAGVVASNGELWIGGDALWFSKDGGKRLSPCCLPKECDPSKVNNDLKGVGSQAVQSGLVVAA